MLSKNDSTPFSVLLFLFFSLFALDRLLPLQEAAIGQKRSFSDNKTA